MKYTHGNWIHFDHSRGTCRFCIDDRIRRGYSHGTYGQWLKRQARFNKEHPVASAIYDWFILIMAIYFIFWYLPST